MGTELGQQTVEFSALVSRAAEDSFVALKELVEKEKEKSQSLLLSSSTSTSTSSSSSGEASQLDTERKINLLKYIVKTQQRMLRLNVLAKWCQQVLKVCSFCLRMSKFFGFSSFYWGNFGFFFLYFLCFWVIGFGVELVVLTESEVFFFHWLVEGETKRIWNFGFLCVWVYWF